MTRCEVCHACIDPRVDVRWDIKGDVLCSIDCVWLYQQREGCV